MNNWYRKACANNRFWDVWERHDGYSAAGFPIYLSKTEYGRAALVVDFDRGTAHADVYLDQKSVPVDYENGELRFGNTYETTSPVKAESRVHSACFKIEPQVVSKLASLDADRSLWWFMYMRLWHPEDAAPAVIAGSDDLVGSSKFGDEILASMSHDLKKWASAAEWERVDRYLSTPKSDFMRSLLRASADSAGKIGEALMNTSRAAPNDLGRGNSYLVDNWNDMKLRNSRALATVAARQM